MKKLMLLHGWGMLPSTWQGMTQLLPNIEVVAPALPGYCNTEMPDPYSLENLADAVLAGQSAPVALCGWSLGAMVAMCAAARHPDKVSHLILVGATPSFVRREDWPDAIDDEMVGQLAAALNRDARAALKRFILMFNQNDVRASAITRELTGAVLSGDLPPQPPLQGGLELLRQVDLRSVAAAIRQPALIIHGARDALMPLAAANWLAHFIPGARLEVLAEAAHAPHLSDPLRCARLIADFVASPSADATHA